MITPLRCGVDTLEATFDGELSDEIVEELQRRKEQAIATGEPEEVLVDCHRFYVLPKGSGWWPYTIRNDYMIIQLGTSAHIPKMKVHLLAQGLAEMGLDKMWELARYVADQLGIRFLNCTRIDIAVDYHGEFFTFADTLNVVCSSGFRPVYPNTEKPETFQFGKSEMLVRVYRKSVEIVAHDHEWWVFVWRLSDAYREREPVHRVEVQLRGKVLRELGFHSVEHIADNLYNLFAYGLEWCSMRVPTEDSNKSRWPEDPRWTALRTAFEPTEALGRTRPIQALIGYDRVLRRAVSVLTSAGAAMGSTDFWHVAKALTNDAEQLIEREMDTTFEALVEKKRRRRYL